MDRRFFMTAIAAGATSLTAGKTLAGESAKNDHQRPTYHFMPPKNWMNDPNGLIHINGEYHLFYQHNPYGPRWGNMTWGHAKSKDLVRWEHLPLALHPDMPYDEGGVFSGCMVNDNGMATAFYTGVSGPGGTSRQVQCIATSRDMITWKKYEANPVIASPPPGVASPDFRDPYVWRDGDEWLMAVGASMKGVHGAVVLYGSRDLREWEYLGPLYVGDGIKHGRMFECPSFFPLGDKWVLVVSPMRARSNYFVGDFKDHRFTPERYEELDQGGGMYATQVFFDDAGRAILFGWVWENRLWGERGGWQGAQTLPRVLTLGDDSKLRYAPADEVVTLRGRPLDGQALAGDCLEIVAEIDGRDADEYGLVVRGAPRGLERTLIVHSRKKKTLSLDRSRSSLDPLVDRSTQSTALALASSERLRLRVFVDRSVIEVFANDRACLTSRVYPVLAESVEAANYSLGGKARVAKLNAWEMNG